MREYWVIDPASRHMEVYALAEGAYRQLDEKEGRFDSTVLPGFFLRPPWLWQTPLPEVLEILRQLKALG